MKVLCSVPVGLLRLSPTLSSKRWDTFRAELCERFFYSIQNPFLLEDFSWPLTLSPPNLA